MAARAVSPSVRFREAIPTSSLAHLQRLSHKLVDIRNTDPSTRVTSLALAVQASRLDVAEWLMDEGHEEGEISRDALGETPLHVAAGVGAYDIAELYLLAYPFVLEWVNAKGATPLHSACMKGQVDCAQLLLESGADIDAPDLLGNTPLHYASAWGKIPVIKLLVEMDCQVGNKNNEGFTAADYAYSFATLKGLEDYARAHFEQQKRTRKHSKASRMEASPKSRRANSSSQGTTFEPPLPTPESAINEDYVGLGMNVNTSPSAVSRTIRASPSTSHLTPSSSFPNLAPSSQSTPPPLSLKKIGRTPSATSSTIPSAPPSPAVDSIRKISMRDFDAIESFRNFQGPTIGITGSSSTTTPRSEATSPSRGIVPAAPTPPPPVGIATGIGIATGVGMAPQRRPTAITIPAIGSKDLEGSRTRSGSNASSYGFPPVDPLANSGPTSEVMRSRSGSNLSSGSSAAGGPIAPTRLRETPSTPTNLIFPQPSPINPLSPVPPTPPSASGKPILQQSASDPPPIPTPTSVPIETLKKERRLSSVIHAVNEGAMHRGRSGSNDSAASSGPGRVARAFGLGKRT